MSKMAHLFKLLSFIIAVSDSQKWKQYRKIAIRKLKNGLSYHTSGLFRPIQSNWVFHQWEKSDSGLLTSGLLMQVVSRHV